MAQLTEQYNNLESALVTHDQDLYQGSSTAYSREVIEDAERCRT